MAALRRALIRIFLPGTFIALLTAIGGMVFLSPEQCPDGYTQARVDAAGCAIGANIGLGLVLMLAIAIEAIAVLATIIAAIIQRNKNK